MADFAPLITRAIAGLEKNTAENRRVLYDRARSALVTQLRSIDPPLSESEITRERLGLEEAIRRIESEIARGQRDTALRPPPAANADAPPAAAAAPAPAKPDVPPDAKPGAGPEMPPPAERKPGSFQARIDRLTTGEGKQLLTAGLRDEKTLLEEKQETALAGDAGKAAAAPSPDTRAPETTTPEAKPADSKPAESKPGDAPPPAAAAAPNAEVPDAKAPDARVPGAKVSGAKVSGAKVSGAPPADLQPVEAAAPQPAPGPAVAPPPLAPRPAGRAARAPAGQPPANGDAAGPAAPRRAKIEPRPVAGRPRYDEVEVADEAAGGRARFWTIIVGLVVLVLLAAAVGLLAASGRLPWFGAGPTTETEAPPPQPGDRPKISDRITQDAPRSPTAQQPQPQPQSPPPAQALQVAQRAILYEEDPAAGQQGQVLIGTVAWRTETVTPGAGLPPDLAIRAEVQVPDRRMSATLTLRRNVDAALPASHTIELVFTTPPDFPFGGVAKVPGILAKRGEGQRGAPLAGLAVDVTAGFFIVGLSAIEADVQRNLQLLKERAWLDIPLVYKNGRRAILSIEKGIPGDHVFAEAFAAWGQ